MGAAENTGENAGRRTEVVYDGPAMTPWTAAYVWAAVISNLPRLPPGADHLTRDRVGDSPARALLARAITINARATGLLDGGLVAGPGVVGSMSLPALMGRFELPLPVLEFWRSDRGYHPAPGEPGYQAYVQVLDMIRGSGVTAGDALTDPRLLADLERGADALVAEVNKASIALVLAVDRFAAEAGVATGGRAADDQDVTFAQMSRYVNDYLQQLWSPPDDDTQFRSALAHVLGWPGGSVPAGLITGGGTWYKVTFFAGTSHPERSLAWCQWLVHRGMGDPRGRRPGLLAGAAQGMGRAGAGTREGYGLRQLGLDGVV